MYTSDNVRLFRRFADSTLRGVVELPGDRVGLVFDGGEVVAVHNPVMLDAFRSEAALRELESSLSGACVSLASIANVNGAACTDSKHDSRAEAKALRKAATAVTATPRRMVSLLDVEGPAFLRDVDIIGTPTHSDTELRHRDETLARDAWGEV